jgi:hypothetical protein
LLQGALVLHRIQMKRLSVILLLLAFATYYVPVVKNLVNGDNTCMTDLDEEKTPEKKKENTSDKKELKEFLGAAHGVPMQATIKFSYLHSSHCLGDNPTADILTPPPNQA